MKEAAGEANMTVVTIVLIAIVLGVGIPKLNIYMTKKSEQKRAAERVANPVNTMYKPANLAFLSKEIDDSSTSKIINR